MVFFQLYILYTSLSSLCIPPHSHLSLSLILHPHPSLYSLHSSFTPFFPLPRTSSAFLSSNITEEKKATRPTLCQGDHSTSPLTLLLTLPTSSCLPACLTPPALSLYPLSPHSLLSLTLPFTSNLPVSLSLSTSSNSHHHPHTFLTPHRCLTSL